MAPKTPAVKYMLGASQSEIDRLAFQAQVWRSMTDGLLDRVGVTPGWRCLDVGAGIGMVALPLAERVGPEGRVTAIEASALYAATMREELARKNIDNVEIWEGDVRKFTAKAGSFDLIFARWVFSFFPDVERVLGRLLPFLKRGGVLAIEDYHHLGCAYYPTRPSFDEVIEGARRWYSKTGGNPRIAGELPALYRKLGLTQVEVVPHVRVGDAKSDLWKWSELFFLDHLPNMIRDGAVTPELARRFEKDLAAVKKVPGALFVVPTIFDVIGRK